jgi:sugar phosphate permease
MGTFIGLTIYVPIYLEGVIGLTASQSGMALVPLMIGTVMGATVSGRSMTYLKQYKRLPLIGLSVAVASCVFLAFKAPVLPLAALEVLLLLISLGLGTVFPLATIAIQNAVAYHQLGTATATMNFFRSLGGALIVAVFGTIVIGGGGAQAISFDSGTTISTADVMRLGHTFQYVFAAAAVGLLLSLLWLTLMEQRPLRERPKASENAGEALPMMME